VSTRVTTGKRLNDRRGLGREDVLEKCVGSADVFLRDHWSRTPLLHDDARDVTGLLSLADVDHLVTSAFLRWPAFRLVKAGQQIEPPDYTRSAILGWNQLDDVIDPGRVLAAFYEGATIVLQGLHRYWPPLTRFCRDLELRLTHPVQCNAYVTPPRSQGLEVHYDTHDVLVLQTEGSKRWEIYDRVIDHPLVSQRFVPEEHPPETLDTGEPRLASELTAGQSLYIPAGFLHQAVSTDEVSVHLTISISPYTWTHVLWEVFGDACQDVAFRDPLPVSFAEDTAGLSEQVDQRLKLFGRWLETIDREQLARRLASRFWSTRAPIRSGQLEHLIPSDALTDESMVTMRDGVIARLESPAADGQPLVMLLGDARLEMPARLEPVLRTVLERTRLRVGELAEWLDEQSRIVLVRRLVREGMLEVTDG
jgi:lysine-specific demethylase/histidyl-hydroxylase NO66